MSSRRRAILATGISMTFFAGAILGYCVRWIQDPGLREVRDSGDSGTVAGGAAPGEPAPRAPPASRTARTRPPDRRGSPAPGSSIALEGRNRDDLVEILREAAQSHDAQGFWLSASAIGPLEPHEIRQVAEMLRESQKDPKAVELFFGELVRYGDADGLEAVAQFVKDDKTDARLRDIAIDALADVSPGRREQTITILEELLKSDLPLDEVAGARTLGRLLGPNAVSGLVELFDSWARKPDGSQPTEKEWQHELNILRALQDFAAPEDRELLLGLFRHPLDREHQALLCQILATTAAGEGAMVMMDLLLKPPEGALRRIIADTLAKIATKDDLPRIRAALEEEKDPRVQMVLASLMANFGGTEEMKQLVQRALDPTSGLSPEAIINALARAENQEMTPLLLDLVPRVHDDFAVVRLSKSVLRLLGREEGAEKLLSTFTGTRNYTMVSEVARAMIEDDPEHDPRRLVALLDRFTDGVCRAAIADVVKNERRENDAGRNAELIPSLARILSTETDATSQEHIASAIASLGPDGMRSLGELLDRDSDPRRRFQVLRSMEFFSPEQTAAIARRVSRQDPSPEMRREAAKILGMSSDPSVLEDLASALASEEDSEVRGTIEEILQRSGTQ